MPRKNVLKYKENLTKVEIIPQKDKSRALRLRDKLRPREPLQSIDNVGLPATGLPAEKGVSAPIGNIIRTIHQNPAFEPFKEVECEFVGYGEYSSTALEYLGYLENFAVLPECFITFQTEITESMRSTYIDWIVNAHRMFNLVQETLFITVQLLDRYINAVDIPKDEFKLIVTTCLLIASKYEERSYPSIDCYVQVSGGVYTSNQILSTESKILNAVEFDFSPTVPIYFLLRIQKTCGINDTPYHLAAYFLESCLLDASMSKYLPSMLAAAAMYLSITVFNLTECYPQFATVSGYTREKLMPIIVRIPQIMEASEKNDLKAVTKKYALRERSCASTLPQLRLNHFKRLTYFSR